MGFVRANPCDLVIDPARLVAALESPVGRVRTNLDPRLVARLDALTGGAAAANERVRVLVTLDGDVGALDAARDRRRRSVRDVDDDPRRGGEAEDAEARPAAQPEPVGDDALEVAGLLDLPQVRAPRRDDAGQRGWSRAFVCPRALRTMMRMRLVPSSDTGLPEPSATIRLT